MRRLATFLLLASAALSVAAQPVLHDALPKTFRQAIPPKLKGGLMLVDLSDRCSSCEPWREVEFNSNTSATPITTEKVSVVAGYRAMYAYPDTHYFSNTKIEQSAADRFEADRAIIEGWIQHTCKLKMERVAEYFAANPQVKDRVDHRRMAGRDYVELEEQERNGVAYISCVENVIGLTGDGAISVVVMFIPKSRVTVTAYLLKQKKAKFFTIGEFRKLRDEFIDAYTAFVSSSQE